MSKIQDLRTWMVLFELLMIVKTKQSNSDILKWKKEQNVQEETKLTVAGHLSF